MALAVLHLRAGLCASLVLSLCLHAPRMSIARPEGCMAGRTMDNHQRIRATCHLALPAQALLDIDCGASSFEPACSIVVPPGHVSTPLAERVQSMPQSACVQA
ncbi:unnamed protein product [Effrenium voratum]|nr:unnamed protein product [Effrenium voratum]